MHRPLTTIVASALAASLATCASHNPPSISGHKPTEIIGEYTQSLPKDAQYKFLMDIYDNPLEAKPIETAMDQGISPDRIYSIIGVGLMNQREKISTNLAQMRKDGVPVSDDRFQQSLWNLLRTGAILDDVKQRGIATFEKGFTTGDLQWYLGSIGDK
jgi:hypothetical protein